MSEALQREPRPGREADAPPPPAHEATRRSIAGPVARRGRLLVLAVLFLGALLVRLDGIDNPSVASRELQNALLARQYHLGDGDGLPAAKQRVLEELRGFIRPLEPPVLDVFAATAFRLTGGERLWIPRLASSLFWLLGGVLLYLIASRVARPDGAVFAVALYLFWPYPAAISRLYQPDAMMIALLLAAALAVIRYWEQPTRWRFGAAAALSAGATLSKPGIALLFLLSLFVALAIWRRAFVETTVRGRLPLFLAVAVAPAAAYYVYGVFVRDFLVGQGSGWIDPSRLRTAWFWEGWWEMVSIMLASPQPQLYLAVVPLVAGVAGVLVTRGLARAILLGLLAGYILFCLTLTVQIASHPYYSLPLVPALALSIGALVGALSAWLERRAPGARMGLLALCAASILVAGYKAHAMLTARPPASAIADYERIGEVTGHTTRAIVVDVRLRSPITYWGWIIARYWYPPTPAQDLPTSGDVFPGRIDAAAAEYLIVMELSELETEPRLRAFTRDLPVVERTERYAVFDLRGGRAVAAERQSDLRSSG